jgi:DNA mismatch endonuclease, patch repair protein
MADVFTKEKRSEVMSRIRGKNTKPEYFVRSALHQQGFRFRLHVPNLPGKPDLVFPKYNALIFVHGCFWHGHDCHLFKWPSTREEFWRTKILSNRENDQRVLKALKKKGWRVLVVWECAIKGKKRLDSKEVIKKISTWLKSTNILKEIKGRSCGSF